MSTRRIGVLLTSLGMQTIGLGAYAVALLAIGRWPSLGWELVPWAIALAVVGVTSLAALYKAFALGPIAVVSPVVASYAAITVVLVVIFLGERLNAGQTAAIVLTFAGVMVASTDVRELRRTLGRPSAPLARQGALPLGVRIGLLATVGFGIWGALFAAAARATDGLAIIVALRACSVLVLAAFALARRTSFVPLAPPRLLALVATVGVLDTGANVLLALGIQSGYASFVMTGSGAYPLIPAILAILVLGERLAPNQYIGVGVLVAGLVALGLQS